MIYWLHLLGRHLARLIPLPVSYGLAALGAPLVYFVWPSKRRNAVANVVQMLGPGQTRAAAERLALAAFRNYGRYLIDMLRLGGAEIARVERHLTVRGVEHLDAALARGKGLIFVGGHLGNSDLAVAVLAGRGYPITIIAETLQPPRWNALVQRTRHAAGVRTIPPESGVRGSLDVLRRNEVLGILIDRPTHGEAQGVAVRFFDAWTRVPGGVATLALRTGASILPACMVRDGSGWVIHVQPPILAERSARLETDVQRLTQQTMDAMEEFVRQYPDQWFMFRPMWPAVPAEPAVYALGGQA
jgi:lauroyl/myristoyl acyltransferase